MVIEGLDKPSKREKGEIFSFLLNMRGVFWNMRGFGGVKRRFLSELFMDMKVDFLGLQ